MSNGIVEKFHRCLKQILSKVTAKFPTEWDNFRPATLFAYNDAPHRPTGTSQVNEIIFGSSIRGMLSLLGDMWIRTDVIQYQTFNTHLTDLRNRIVRGCQLAIQHLAEAGEIYLELNNHGRKLRTLKPNDEVLLLLSEKTKSYLHHGRSHSLLLNKVPQSITSSMGEVTINCFMWTCWNHTIPEMGAMLKKYPRHWHKSNMLMLLQRLIMSMKRQVVVFRYHIPCFKRQKVGKMFI